MHITFTTAALAMQAPTMSIDGAHNLPCNGLCTRSSSARTPLKSIRANLADAKDTDCASSAFDADRKACSTVKPAGKAGSTGKTTRKRRSRKWTHRKKGTVPRPKPVLDPKYSKPFVYRPVFGGIPSDQFVSMWEQLTEDDKRARPNYLQEKALHHYICSERDFHDLVCNEDE